jgi:crossover junction endodeoxyribonuclease RuvC
VRILGIDPGLLRTGWGVIDKEGNRLSFVACGVITPSAQLTLPQRLALIDMGLQSILNDYKPDCAAVEETFVNTNAVSTLKLGQARGVALVVPARYGLDVFEYAATQVKKTVVGAGRADKNQIIHMVKILLPKADIKTADSADALAVAICHAHHK